MYRSARVSRGRRKGLVEQVGQLAGMTDGGGELGNGASQGSLWQGRRRAGYGQYFMGTAPLYYLAAALRRLFEYPALIGTVAMLWGYFTSWRQGLPRYDDPEFRRFLRRYQYRCLIFGKRAATARLDAKSDAARAGV